MTTTTGRTASRSPLPRPDDAGLEQLLEVLRDRQAGLQLADQRHQFLDVDQALDYTRRTAPAEGVLRDDLP